MRKNYLPNQKRLSLKIIRVNPSLRITTDCVPTNGRIATESVVIVHTFQTVIVAEITVMPDLFTSKLHLTRLFHSMTHCSRALFKLIKSPNQESEETNKTPHTCRPGMSGQHFFSKYFNRPSKTQRNIMALGFNFSLILAQGAHLSTAILSQRLRNSNH